MLFCKQILSSFISEEIRWCERLDGIANKIVPVHPPLPLASFTKMLSICTHAYIKIV